MQPRYWRLRPQLPSGDSLLGRGVQGNERRKPTAMRLISFSFYATNRSMHPSLYLTLYPRAEPCDQSLGALDKQSVALELLRTPRRLCNSTCRAHRADLSGDQENHYEGKRDHATSHVP